MARKKTRRKRSKGKGWHGDKIGHSIAAEQGWKNHCKKEVLRRPKTTLRLLKLR